MGAEIIDGKQLAEALRKEIKAEVEQLTQQGITPGLAVILVGNDPASRTYVKNKEKACRALGMKSVLIELPGDVPEQALLGHIATLNEDPDIHGILVQLPLPPHINAQKIVEAISPEKDVDGFHPVNIGRMMTGQDAFLPCTPHGILKMVKSKDIRIEGKHVVVIGRSNIVGKPCGQLFLNENATVTYCHSKTADLKSFTRQADILVSAVGKAKFIKADFVKAGAVVIDVGMNRDESGKLCGDVDFDEVKEKASYITPVPGGVGPMTITMLLSNTVKAAKRLRR
ncbi:MAG: bifunctional methylenetetrahydrofolate dehydrogenase/methenyltetrahydrofolate cyclohydrolase FolD [Weizmannia coagulans]|jgi:methylenetetrahydrofolate dehydrogenase (NADP+)/methenyltetrahydrofolate cyclohydrolase|uniref:bifunctional methylenetetrahydrofolate dehydrogenase/methenyltetrahydrofolate cyclohydrolase FolD n=1 Tax=Heyndrickxia TaxID=2837504 RepID=UPI0005509D62|nr:MULTISPECIES: bifunctional methylenetetrahydrofolate dehydrogenase/methenyltetrahydrofolate cyclohydrolase FolD [Heyndrickxia]KGT40180.1 5,10-methylene-tetrahydrofolate cyclohydrolase [Heyndrickxia coagulans P38]KYC64083.1 Methylenetetrahydrofolate dehydrogenase (NADP+) [Heyndrickxia coagulans]KYC91648.1 Methylenetetrahydrofolate dehydrogenase (NADP+) [Heyndrickxia coagulans]MCI1574446.1 bifunctional methylenetetrahydrofolate dehydrogenase/methenyltetrahydrofolate cyclohydrolase FolD [Heyndr